MSLTSERDSRSLTSMLKELIDDSLIETYWAAVHYLGSTDLVLFLNVRVGVATSLLRTDYLAC